MMKKVFISPTWTGPDRAEGGIRRVIEAMEEHLPAYGWVVVTSPDDADLINSHGSELVTGHERKPVVQSNHGLMWSEYFTEQWAAVNRQCVNAMKRADAVTFPSEWVRRAVSRGVALESQTIHHGVDANVWKPKKEHGGYALWNKARTDAVSDHAEVEKLAALLPDVPFVTTIGTATKNLKNCGVVPVDEMRPIVQRAGVYLALPRETFGIGTLEAMACGVPIAGWRYGGQAEIVKEGETGYLAPYGDWAALGDAVSHCLSDRARLGANARADVLARWGWEDKIAQYAALFDRVLEADRTPVKTSIILTCFNLAQFLPEALASVAAQTSADWECIIMDDCSADKTEQVAREWMTKDARFRYMRPPRNLGLPEARNFAIARAEGKYVLPLDADDRLLPDAVAFLAAGMDADRATSIGYGHLDLMSHDGTQQRRSPWDPTDFQWKEQLAHHNQSHYGAMLRKSVFRRTEGYRHRSWQAEDAEFWCYATSFGMDAHRLTDQSTHVYRMRGDSKTHDNRAMGTEWSDGDWAAWYPYLKAPLATPFGAQGESPAKGWRISHGATPAVSVVIPVGPGHEALVQDALDSLLAQTFTEWEAIVVNDSGRPLAPRGYQFARWFDTEGKRGAGHARNVGARAARAPLLVFLDADDFLQPRYLEETMRAQAAYPGQLIYTDWYQENGTGNSKLWEAQDFQCEAILKAMIYNVTVLHPTAAFHAAGGFDETLPGWEDWDYFIKLAKRGICALHLASPLMTYRYQTGGRREKAYENKAELLDVIQNRYKEEREGRIPMACGSCGGGKISAPPQVNVKTMNTDGMVLMEYLGAEMNTHRIVGKATGTAYRFGASKEHHQKYVFAQDVASLVSQRKYRVVAKSNMLTGAALSPLVVRDRPEPQNARPPEPEVVTPAPAPIIVTPVPAPVPAPVKPEPELKRKGKRATAALAA